MDIFVALPTYNANLVIGIFPRLAIWLVALVVNFQSIEIVGAAVMTKGMGFLVGKRKVTPLPTLEFFSILFSNITLHVQWPKSSTMFVRSTQVAECLLNLPSMSSALNAIKGYEDFSFVAHKLQGLFLRFFCPFRKDYRIGSGLGQRAPVSRC